MSDQNQVEVNVVSQSHCTDQGNAEGLLFKYLSWLTYHPFRGQ